MSPIRTDSVWPSHILTYVFIGIVVLLLFSYIIFQARLLIAGPQITLDSIPQTIQTERTVTVSGSAENITEIALNGRPIVTNESGHFNETIVLQNGYTIIRIDASDRYGRGTKVEHEFVYTPLSLLPN
ncbi:MAG: hypothetical protein ACI9VM_000654 [Candidatus Azotimanducaceae bacterium]|jgi:hypothetical protein